MRIAIVSDQILSGSHESPAYSKALALSDRGHEVYLLHQGKTNGASSFDGRIRLLCVGGAHENDGMQETPGALEILSARIADAIEALDRVVKLDVVEFPDHGNEGQSYLMGRDANSGFPVIVQNRGPLPALASAIGKSDLVFQPNLPPDAIETGETSSRLAVLKTETFYHYAVNRAMSFSSRVMQLV